VNRQITVEISNEVHLALSRRAKDIGRGTRIEDVAEDVLQQYARERQDVNTLFTDAMREYTRQQSLKAFDETAADYLKKQATK
jgi:hypothetical protein